MRGIFSAPRLCDTFSQWRSIQTASKMTRDYAAAVAALNTLQTNFSVIESIRKSGRGMNDQAIPEMIQWCRRIGYEPEELDRIRPIHIAGTKGKGSTSAMISSILAQYKDAAPANGRRMNRIGLYTSPHLRFVRERIQINGEPLSEESFARYFFETWDSLENAAKREDHPDPSDKSTKPVYFRFLTLMAFHTYVRENVDSAVIECGIGGEYDSTNIIQNPSVTGVTSLGIDHTAMLGNTIEEIAWHKAGIFKPGVPAFSVEQPQGAMRVLQEKARERDTALRTVARHPELENIKLGLGADFQKTNASLAIAIAATHLRNLGYDSVPDADQIRQSPLPPRFRRGLETVRWPGRCELRRDGNVLWYLDGGHTMESIEVAGKWFASQILQSQTEAPSSKRILIFNQQKRDASALARALHKTLAEALSSVQPFTHAIFCSNTTFKDTGFKPDLVSINTNSQDVESLRVQQALADSWRDIDPKTEVEVVRSIEEAAETARNIAQSEKSDIPVLVTGSLITVGGFIDVLETQGIRQQ